MFCRAGCRAPVPEKRLGPDTTETKLQKNGEAPGNRRSEEGGGERAHPRLCLEEDGRGASRAMDTVR